MSVAQQLLKYSPHVNVASGATLLAGYTSVASPGTGVTDTFNPPAIPTLTSGRAYFTLQNVGVGTATITGLASIAGVGTKTFTVNPAGTAWVDVQPSVTKAPDFAATWVASTAYPAYQTFSFTTPATGTILDVSGNLLANNTLYNGAFSTAQTSGAALNAAEIARFDIVAAASGQVEYSFKTTMALSLSATISTGKTMLEHITSKFGNVGILPNHDPALTPANLLTAFGLSGKTLNLRTAGQTTMISGAFPGGLFPTGVFAFSYNGTTLTADQLDGQNFLGRKSYVSNFTMRTNSEYIGRAGVMAVGVSFMRLPNSTDAGSQTITFYNQSGNNHQFQLNLATDKLNGVVNGTYLSNVQGEHVTFICDTASNDWRTVSVKPSVLTGTGNALPADGSTFGLFVLIGHATLPNGTYYYSSAATSWIQL